jgi:hypothetical protein
LPAVTGTILTSASTITPSDGSVTQAKLASGVAGNGPAFSAYRATSDQSFTQNAWTKVQLNAENFDTANCFDSTTNYRFTPNVAGYYQFTANMSLGGAAFYNFYVQIYKNGAGVGQYMNINASSGNFTTFGTTVSTLMSANGSTDYFEVFVYSNSSSPIVNAGANGPSIFTGYLARAA